MKLIIFILLSILACENGFSHGLELRTEEMPPFLVVHAGFSGHHHEIGNVNIRVFSPDSDEPYQEGKTDVHGKFGFGPDRAGTWKVIADDGMGHRETLDILLSEDFFGENREDVVETASQEDTAGSDPSVAHSHEFTIAGIPLLYRVLFGFAIIFGLTGLLFGFMSKMKSR